jgi:hypothetical protein
VLAVDLAFSGPYFMAFFRDASADLVVVLTAYFVLVVGSLAGLLRLRQWGFYFSYVLAPFSTILLGDPLIPLVTRLLPWLDVRIWAMTILNAGFLLGVAYAHRAYRQARSDPTLPAVSVRRALTGYGQVK